MLLLFALVLRTCAANGSLPDATCTPGATMPITTHALCTTSTKERRAVPQSVHRQVFLDYGLAYPQARGAYEVDHLIPLELGGSNDIANLWPEAAMPEPGFHTKDRVENWAHREVCAGRMPLADAQRQIASDWTVLLHRMTSATEQEE